MRKLIGAFLATVVASAAVPAAASTFVYDVDAPTSITLGKSNSYYKGFEDHYLFDITEAGYVNAFISSLASSPSLDVLIKSVLFNDKPIEKISTGALEYWAINDRPVSPGRNTIKVFGYWGSQGGSYTGKFDFSTAAVPEPAAWGMMIAGFGLVGAAMRRRTLKVSYS
jgi:hypothetical protein